MVGINLRSRCHIGIVASRRMGGRLGIWSDFRSFGPLINTLLDGLSLGKDFVLTSLVDVDAPSFVIVLSWRTLDGYVATDTLPAAVAFKADWLTFATFSVHTVALNWFLLLRLLNLLLRLNIISVYIEFLLGVVDQFLNAFNVFFLLFIHAFIILGGFFERRSRLSVFLLLLDSFFGSCCSLFACKHLEFKVLNLVCKFFLDCEVFIWVFACQRHVVGVFLKVQFEVNRRCTLTKELRQFGLEDQSQGHVIFIGIHWNWGRFDASDFVHWCVLNQQVAFVLVLLDCAFARLLRQT